MQCDELRALSQIRLQSAEDCLQDAKLLAQSERYKALTNRSYYAVFHAMRAVLVLDGFDSKKHSGIIAEFRRAYIKTSVFDAEMSNIIGTLSRLVQAVIMTTFSSFQRRKYSTS